MVAASSDRTIPHDHRELLKKLKGATLGGGKVGNRLLKQELQCESIERRLMNLEDMSAAELERRLLRYQEEVLMSEEDIRSGQAERIYRQNVIEAFRDAIRQEAEERKRREEEERAQRRLAAEERRRQVVERLRQQQREEEERAREAERQRALIQAEAERKLKWEESRMASDRAMMPYEEQLSRLAEIDYRENMEKEAWLRHEKSRMEAWEEAQRLKDEEEEKARVERLATLEQKKAKLVELRRQQVLANAANPGNLQASRDEANKLAKNLRIQQRAKKYVTKRTLPIEEPRGSPAHSNEGVHQSLNVPLDEAEIRLAADLSREPTRADPAHILDDDPEMDTMIAIVNTLKSDLELRQHLTSVIAKKRALRLEKNTRLATGDLDSAGEKEIHHQMRILTAQEQVIQARINALADAELAMPGTDIGQQPEPTSARGVQLETLPGQAAVEPAPAARDGALHGESNHNEVATACLTAVAESSTASAHVPSSHDVYHNIERLLHEHSRLMPLIHTNADFARRAGALALEIKEAARHLHDDPLNYRERLEAAGVNLMKAALHTSGRPFTEERLPHTTLSPADDPIGSPHAAVTDHLPIASPSLDGDDRGRDTKSQLTLDPPYVTASRDCSLSAEAVDDQATIDFESLPGWHECLETNMATAAHAAAFFGYLEILEILVMNFDCFVLDEQGRTPLFYAALGNQLDCVILLITIDSGWVDVGDINGDTPLHAAALADHDSDGAVLQFLLQNAEVSPDTANHAGLTPSHLARTQRALQVLNDAGACVYCVDTLSRTPLFCACADGRDDCIAFLLSKTPHHFIMWPDITNGDTPLHIAASNGHDRCVDLISQALSVEDLNIVNKKGQTAAHVAKSCSILRVLYSNGADLFVREGKDRYPLFFAAFNGRADCVAFLLELKSSGEIQGKIAPQALLQITAVDKAGDSALHAAAMQGFTLIAMQLSYFLRNLPNAAGYTPADLAARAGHTHIQQMLLYIEDCRNMQMSPKEIFGCNSFAEISSVILSGHPSRWQKLYDLDSDTCYYSDRVTGMVQWERPRIFDLEPRLERIEDQARECLKRFYSIYNPAKVRDVNTILAAYTGRYEELFLELAERYAVQDLSMFSNVFLE